MTTIGGDIESISFAGRDFNVPTGSDWKLMTGGFKNAIGMNGNGTGRLLKTRVPFSLKGGELDCDLSRGDVEFLQDIADSKRFEVIAITFVDSTVYQGKAQLIDDIEYSAQNATISCSFEGTGKATKQ